MSIITDEFDRVYIAKYFEKLGVSELSKSFETTNSQILKIIEEFKAKGLYQYYKDMPENEWENLSGRSKRRQRELIEEGFKKFQKEIFYKLVKMLKEEKTIFQKYYDPTHIPEIKITGEDEEWKKIPQFEYSISNYGQIRNDKTGTMKKVRRHKWQVTTDIYKDGKRYTLSVPRLEACLFIRKVEKNEIVIHIDGQAMNNYYKNLEIVSK